MMVDEFGSSTVTVKKTELLETIRKNRAAHKATYDEAVAGYREESVAKLTSMLEAAKGGQHIETSTGLKPPVQHLKDYDRVVRMLEMSTAEEIKISENQFQQYVMDEWSWKEQFATAANMYSNKMGR